MEHFVYNFIDDDDLLRISNKISEIEKLTSGELCISITEKRKFLTGNKSIRELAEKEFFNQGVDKTKDKTGVLIFILLQEKSFYILADKGINEKVEAHTWDKIRDEMGVDFSNGEFSRGLIKGIEETGRILAAHFPVKPDDKNELPNRIIIN
jgi:uncharacterized membrane protein